MHSERSERLGVLMKLREAPHQVREWLRGHRRRQLGAIGLGLGVIAAGIGLPLYFVVFAGGDGGPAVSPPPPSPVATPSPVASVCAPPTLIEPPQTTAADDWQDVSPPPVNDCFSMAAGDADASGVTVDT